jgi:flagellar motor switch protein FliN/FliY
MDQNKTHEETMIKDDEISWDDVQEELNATATSSQQQEVSGITFKELTKGAPTNGGLDLDFLMDIPLTLTAELGRTKMLIGELLKLGQGSVVELSKLAGEPMDIFVNNRLVARGEVVVVNEKFGVRLTDVASHAERVTNLK